MLFNTKTRNWIQDTPRNRARLQRNVVKPKIRNPRTGYMVMASARNIRAAERFREQRVRELMERRAATRIATRARRFIQQRDRMGDFHFEETSENFQTASLHLPPDVFSDDTNDLPILRAFLQNKPQYRTCRVFIRGQRRALGEEEASDFVISSPVMDIEGDTSELIRTSIKTLKEELKMYYKANIHSINVDFAQRVGGKCESKADVPAYLLKKQSVIKIYNTDNLCGQRCLVLGRLHGNRDKRKNLCKPGRAKQFTKEAAKLAWAINHKTTMAFADFEKFTAEYPEYTVHIWNALNQCSFSCGTGSQDIDIFYDSENAHYHFIANPDGLQRKNKVCPHCHQSYRVDRGHVCKGKFQCSHCLEQFNSDKELRVHRIQLKKQEKLELCCKLCNQWAQSPECAKKHVEHCKGTSWMCHECHAVDWRKGWIKPEEKDQHYNEHGQCRVCKDGLTKCPNCGELVSEDHRCHMQPLEAKPIENGDLGDNNVIVFDFESFAVDQHIVNECHWENLHTGETGMTTGEFALRDFAKMVYEQKQTIFVAHNGRGYDFPLLSHALHEQYGIYPKKIHNGSKIMRMQIKSNVFIDSLSHIAGRLSSFPKTFGLDVSVRKGYYPYLFDTPETQAYVGPIPDAKYFIPDSMSSDDRREFDEWHLKQRLKGDPWDLRKERTAYCRNDVHILAESMKVYIASGIEEAGINPLTVTTIASFVMRTFRTNHLEKDTIGVMTKEERKFAQDGFFGGRTDITNASFELTEKQVEQGWKIRYDDIVSLYPSVMWYKNMPWGHPTIETNVEGASHELAEILNKSFGFAKCDVSPPKKLLYPVLPGYDSEGKLNFTLHDQTGTWTIVELQRAIREGYTINKIHEIHHYKQRGDLFKGIIGKYFKGKQESSWKGKPEDLPTFIAENKRLYGVDLDPEKCVYNPGRRQLCKLILNSLWGKFAQRTNLIKEHICRDAKSFYGLLNKNREKKIEIKQWTVLNDTKENHAMHVSYVDLDEKDDGSYMTNHALAAHVTAHARLRLYDEMTKVGSNLLGHDTDSLWYAVPPGGYEIPEGNQLGEWEPEDISTGPYRIVGVQGTGPKSYSMKYQRIMDAEEREESIRKTERDLAERIETIVGNITKDSDIKSNEFHRQLTELQSCHNGIVTRITKSKENRKAINAYIGNRTDSLQLDYETIERPIESVHAKGVTLNSANAHVDYDLMKQIVDEKITVTAVGTALKRERIKGTDEMTIRTLRPEEREKIIQFTATKRDPSPERKHLPGFTVPRGYQYAEIMR